MVCARWLFDVKVRLIVGVWWGFFFFMCCVVFLDCDLCYFLG